MSKDCGPKIITHCPLCRAEYQSSEIKMLGEKGAARLFHCTCQACGHSVLAIVLEISGAVSSVGVITDLELSDALRFRDFPPISSDDCLSAHRSMSSESREFCRRLLDKKAKNA